jgi:hypothetical protein
MNVQPFIYLTQVTNKPYPPREECAFVLENSAVTNNEKLESYQENGKEKM